MNFVATRHAVKDRGTPPESFLTELVEWAKVAPDEIFAANDDPEDVFNRLEPLLGPWQSLQHRRAAHCELLRCLGGFESSWKWREGVDRTNASSQRNIRGQETGIFQVSYDSLDLDNRERELHSCVSHFCKTWDVQTFIDQMKIDHRFALEYCARLLRNNFYWDGPIKRHEIDSYLSKSAVAEFIQLLV